LIEVVVASDDIGDGSLFRDNKGDWISGFSSKEGHGNAPFSTSKSLAYACIHFFVGEDP